MTASPMAISVAPLPTRIPFNGSPEPTLGVELELQILDPETRNLTSGSVAILNKLGDDPNIKQELTQSTVEVITGICNSVAESTADLRQSTQRLMAVGDELGLGFASAGTHPFGQWRNQSIFPNDRYEQLVERIQWPARRLLIYGLHVHVGVPSGEAAIAISNSLTRFLPHLLALSSSSPFVDFEDSGLASARAKLFEGMPTAGLPFRLSNYGEFQSFINALINAKAIQSVREIWWDIRPHPGFGTLEVRICDAPSTLEETAAITALIHCLIVWLQECYENGAMGHLLRPWIIRENKWRATRFGLDASVITDNSGTQASLRDDLAAQLDVLKPYAEQLGCTMELDKVAAVLAEGASYERQRRVYAETGSYEDVVQYLMDAWRESVNASPN